MTVPVADLNGVIAAAAQSEVLERTGRVQSFILGPGLGRDPETLDFARAVAKQAEVPLLLDADGLNAHASPEHFGALAQRRAATVITPHAGELGQIGRASCRERV